MFIGDSLVSQTFMTASCFQEMFSFHGLHLDKIFESFLRNDIPCLPECLSNVTFREFNRNLWYSPCSACADGIRGNFTEYLNSPDAWMNRIPEDTLAIVMGSGPWYSDWKGIHHSNLVFEETMKMISPTITKLIHKRKIIVIWQGLPPMKFDGYVPISNYDWNHYPAKDSLARKILEPLGVHFLNVSNLIYERKFHDRNISSDGLHWCHPGVESVSAFLYQLILQIIVTDIMKQKKQ
jgi:hypothetical protein